MERDEQALKACIEDAISLLHLFRSATQHPQAALLFQGFIAHGSLYVVESQRCITTVFPELCDVFSKIDFEFLASSRHRAKLLDYRSIVDVSQELIGIAKHQQVEFNKEHRGILAPLKRALQGDVGLSVCGNHIFWTTHATVYSFGDQDINGENASRFGYAFGQYIAALLGIFEIDETRITGEAYKLGTIEMRDIKYQALYARGSLGSAGVDIGAALALILAAINLARFVVRPILPNGNMTGLRLMFLTAYHAVAGLVTIQNYLQAKQSESENALCVLRDAIGNSDARWLRRHSNLRNLFTHYLLDKKDKSIVGQGADRAEVVAALAGKSADEVDALVDRYLARLSLILELGFDIQGKDPFWYGRV